MGPVVLALAAALGLGLGSMSEPAAAATPGPATYSATQTTPVPPASSYAGSAGGDGWAVALTPTAVYNVFHHASTLQVACHLQSDASACWSPKTITGPNATQFAVGGHPGLALRNGRLYVYATRSSDSTAGVVCIDTTQPASNLNPFCGFTALTTPGDAPPGALSNAVMVGSRWYAFNYATGSGVIGTKNKLMCFDLSTVAACPGQPFTVDLGVPTVSANSFTPPAVTAIAGRIIVPFNSTQLACYDANTGTGCSGAWPVTLTSAYASSFGAAFPLMNSTGTITGLCLPTSTNPCFNFAGAPVATPGGMTSVIGSNSPWNGPAFVLGPRVYVPNGVSNTVRCYDYATSASCANFPRTFSNLSLLYTVNPDPQRPTCVWVNADGGSAQIQNFDAYTGGVCGEGPIRILASSFVVPTQTCLPTNYTSLQVIDPTRNEYTSGTVSFRDGDANPVPGLPDMPLGSTGAVNLSGLNLNTQHGLPQFLITLNGGQGAPGAVTVRLTWTGANNPACVKPGTVVRATASPYPLPPVLSGLPKPVLGRLVNVEVVRGRVYVSLPPGTARASARVPGIKGRNFVRLRGKRQIPVRSLLDTRKGTVKLTSARDPAGTPQTANLLSGVFQVLQSRKASAKGLTEARLKGASFRRCRGSRAKKFSGRVGRAAAKRHSKRAVRRLRANGVGRFRTRGRYSSATVRGTDWTVIDRCDGTLTKVTRGSVTVRDFRRKKTVTLRSGKRYLAEASH